MKILQISSHFSPNVGGVETHLDDLVLALKKRKHQVFVLTYRPLTTKAKWKIWQASENLKILRLPWLPGFFYKLVNMPTLEFFYLVPGLFLVTPLVIVFQNPKVIHSHGLVAGLVAVFWGKLLGKRVIVTTHSIYHFPQQGFYRNFAHFIFNNADKILVLSRQSEREIEHLGIPRQKIETFTYWIDLTRFKEVKKAKSKLGWQRGFKVLFVGRLVPEKGVNELLAAAQRWSEKIGLVIIGTGTLENKVERLAKKMVNLTYLGKVSQEKLPLFYSAADLTVVPSVHEEGFGRVILESLACGTPVLASNRGAIPEALNPSVGKLIEISPTNLQRSVENFYQRPDKLRQLKKKTRNFAEGRYSEKNVESIIGSYRN